jgi:hypothetical protein
LLDLTSFTEGSNRRKQPLLAADMTVGEIAEEIGIGSEPGFRPLPKCMFKPI